MAKKRAKPDHEKLVEGALKAINKVFNDTSVEQVKIIHSLQRLVEEIALNIDTIRDEIGDRTEEGPGFGVLPPADPAE